MRTSLKTEGMNRKRFQKKTDNSLFFNKKIPARKDDTAIHKSATGNDLNQSTYPGTSSLTGNIPEKTNAQYKIIPNAVKKFKPATIFSILTFSGI